MVDTGLTKVGNSLRVTITTAGRGRENLAYEVIDYARKVASGEIDDPSTIAFLYETPVDADWTDESIWPLANPGLVHGYPSLTGMRNKARVAKHKPAARDAFRQLHLCQWLGYSASPFLAMTAYDACKGNVDLDDLASMQEPVWVGVDLSTNLDLTAIVMAWGNPDDGFKVHAHFFGPETKSGERDADDVPYLSIGRSGWAGSPSPRVPSSITGRCRITSRSCAMYLVEEIAFDPKGAAVMTNAVPPGEGHPGGRVPARCAELMARAAIKALERASSAASPRWQPHHPALAFREHRRLVRDRQRQHLLPQDRKSNDRIDGAVACADARSEPVRGSPIRAGHPTTTPTRMLRRGHMREVNHGR